jgi:hypothetical protein
VQEVFKENTSKRLLGAIVWTPMLATDYLDAAMQRETEFSDFRVKHYWDPELPPMPDFWMHQLDEEPALLLDPVRLRHNMQAIMEESFSDK